MKARVFLADDEQPVLDGLATTLRKYLPEIEICGTAKNGRDAVEGVSQEQPDLVLMDVKMPLMSGLEALRELKRSAPATIPILLTAYERFDIARTAFELGVFDYLVKPVEQERLVEAVRGALDAARVRREAAQRARSAEMELAASRPFLEEAFLYALVLGGGADLAERARILGFPEAEGFLGVLGFPGIEIADGGPEDKGAEVFRDALAFRTPCAVGGPMQGFIPFFVPGADPVAAGKTVADALDACRLRRAQARLGDWAQGKGLRTSFVQALARFAEAEESGKDDAAQRVLDAAAAADAPALAAAWNETAALMPEGKARDGALAGLAGAAAARCGAAAADAAALGGLCAGGDADGALRALLALAAASDAGNGLAGRDLDRRVGATLAFIAETYASPISLDDAAERVGLSAARLSKLLVQETGLSFVDHLTEARLDRARSELAAGRRSVKEIAAVCGYPDANYFSRAFKKSVGLTPSEYANRHGRSIV